MKGIILPVLSGIGALTVGMKIGDILLFLWDKFNRWRKNGCKIKCLCKPHIYGFYWFFPDSGELALKCKKCGKIKKIIVDEESFDSGMWK